MKTLVLAKSLQQFWRLVDERISKTAVYKVMKNQGRVFLKSGHELIYISSERGLRGYRGVEVEIWAIPEWFTSDSENLIKIARLKEVNRETKD